MSEFNKTYLSAEQMEDGLWPSHMLDDVFLIPSNLTEKERDEEGRGIMLDGNKLKFGDLLVEKGKEYNPLFMFLSYAASRSNVRLLKIPRDIYIPSAPVWKPDYESFLDSYYVHNHGFYRNISIMDYANPDQIKKHNDKANPNLGLGRWLYDCNLYPIRNFYFVGGRGCGKTKLIRQILNSTYGLASADNWAQRYMELTDKCYKTLGIDDKLDTLRYAAEYYGIWNTKEEEKNKMANFSEMYIFTFKNVSGNRYEITIEKDFRRHDYPYQVSVYYLNDNRCEKKLATCLGYRYWEHLETQLMYDLINNGFSIHKDFRDVVTQELMRAKNTFCGCIYNDIDSPYQGGYTTGYKNTSDRSKVKPFEAMPKIEKVIFNPPATIVQWKDGTKTVVKCQDGDEFDWEKGLAMAYVKRAYNNERTYYGLFKKNEPWLNLPNSNVEYDPNNVAKKVVILVPKDLPVTSDIIGKTFEFIMKECDKKIENGIELEQ